jgi:K+-sensing histidine kinase KdpD
MIERVLTNLLDNAIATRRQVACRSRPGQPEWHVAMTVSDTGPGIPAGLARVVFQRPFRRAARTGAAGSVC